ncbi:MAG TPA: BON domain-containing protein [Steroidobacteraceae bacterium]
MALLLLVGLPACASYQRCGPGGCTGDSKLAADVRTRLEGYPALQAPNAIWVQSMNHVVYLSGEVGTDYQRLVAESVAHSVPGVKRVVDSISLEYAGR